MSNICQTVIWPHAGPELENCLRVLYLMVSGILNLDRQVGKSLNYMNVALSRKRTKIPTRHLFITQSTMIAMTVYDYVIVCTHCSNNVSNNAFVRKS